MSLILTDRRTCRRKRWLRRAILCLSPERGGRRSCPWVRHHQCWTHGGSLEHVFRDGRLLAISLSLSLWRREGPLLCTRPRTEKVARGLKVTRLSGVQGVGATHCFLICFYQRVEASRYKDGRVGWVALGCVTGEFVVGQRKLGFRDTNWSFMVRGASQLSKILTGDQKWTEEVVRF